MRETDPLRAVYAGPLTWGADADLRVDTDERQRLVVVYVLEKGTNIATSELTFTYDQARTLARWILANTRLRSR
jgi:hypothetical protein